MSDNCPDCQVAPGERHSESCDVARCSLHGTQWLACDACYDHDYNILVGNEDARPTVWTGEWPGVEECREFDMYVYDFPGIPGKSEDLNKLIFMGMTGELLWSVERERWVRP